MTATAPPVGPVTVVTSSRVKPGHESEFGTWQQRMNDVVSRYPGYVGGEVIPPYPPTQVDWVIVQRFESAARLRDWLDSNERQAMVAELRPILADEDSISVFEGEGEGSAAGPGEQTTAVISAKVAPGAGDRFLDWQQRATAAQSRYAGYVGTQLQPPVEGLQDVWVTMVRFDSPAHLNAWLTSAERAALAAEAQEFIEEQRIRQARTGFGSWFAAPEPGAQVVPAWKQSSIVLLVLFPIIMCELMFLDPFLVWMHRAPATFVGNVISVSLMGFVLVPRVRKLFVWWLEPDPRRTDHVTAKGAAIMLSLYAVLIVFFYFASDLIELPPVTHL